MIYEFPIDTLPLNPPNDPNVGKCYKTLETGDNVALRYTQLGLSDKPIG